MKLSHLMLSGVRFVIAICGWFVPSGAIAATMQLNMETIAGTFPSYTDESGITITYNNGLIVDADRRNGLNGVPIFGSVVSGDTPHLAIAALSTVEDSVTVDFTAALPNFVPGSIRIHLYDLDSPGGFTEKSTITDVFGAGGAYGAPINIEASTALAAPQITDFVYPARGVVTIQSGSGDGHHAFQVEWEQLPEPSSVTLAALSLLSAVSCRRIRVAATVGRRRRLR